MHMCARVEKKKFLRVNLSAVSEKSAAVAVRRRRCRLPPHREQFPRVLPTTHGLDNDIVIIIIISILFRVFEIR